MRHICENLVKPALRIERQLGRPSVHPELRAFAWSLTVLQRRRQSADCDPSVTLEQDDALVTIEEAARAIAAFDRVPHREQADILALLLVGGRS